MFAVINKSTNRAAFLFAEQPYFKNGLAYPIKAPNVTQDNFEVVDVSPPPMPFIGNLLELTDGTWSIADEVAYAEATKPPVPKTIDKRKAKQQLVIDGLYGQVQSAIDSISNPTERLMMEIYWEDSQVFERSHPQLIAMATALGLTSEQIDIMFINASKL